MTTHLTDARRAIGREVVDLTEQRKTVESQRAERLSPVERAA